MKNNKHIIFIFLILIYFLGYSQEEFSHLPKLSLPFNTKIIDDTSLSYNNNFQLDKSSWMKYGFDVLQAYYESSDYKVSGQLYTKENRLLLIERKYSEENSYWVCMIDKENKVIDWLETAYDNSEGFTSIQSVIYKDSVVVTEHNIYTKPEIIKKTYLITKYGFKPKAKYLVIAKNGLTVRSKPGLDSEKIDKLPSGLQVNIIKDTKKYISVIEIDGSWIKIAIENYPIVITNKHTYGYVFSGFLEEKNKVLKMLSKELSKFSELKGYIVDTKHNPFFMQGDFFGDGIEDLVIKANTKEGKTHILFINRGETESYKILGINDALKTTDYSWAGIFKKVNNGEVLWSNYEDDWVKFEDVPENKKVKLNYDALFIHNIESCGGGFIFWKDGKFNWLQQE